MTNRSSTHKQQAAPTWVRRVKETSNAMDLPSGVFLRSPEGIARGLKRSVMASRRTKGTKLQSAMSMLSLFINRAGRKLPPKDRARLESAKVALRRLFGRDPGGLVSRPRASHATKQATERTAKRRLTPR